MRQLKRVAMSIGLVLAGLAIVGVTSVARADAEHKGFWVEKDAVELDKVIAGQDAVATFVFHNDTDKEVKIIKAKPS